MEENNDLGWGLLFINASLRSICQEFVIAINLSGRIVFMALK